MADRPVEARLTQRSGTPGAELVTAAPGRPAAPLPSLRVSFAWIALGRGVYAACQWGLLVALAKLGTPELVGRYTLGVAVSTPVFMLASLKLESVLVTDARGEYRFGEYAGLRLITNLLALPVVAGVVMAAGYAWPSAAVILAVSAAQAVLMQREIHLARLQKAERMHLLALSNATLGPLSLVGFALALWLSGDLLTAIGAVAAARLVVMLALDVPAARHLAAQEHGRSVPVGGAAEGTTGVAFGAGAARPEGAPSGPTAARLGRLAWLSLPLGVVTMLVALVANVPRYLLESAYGERELGFYGALASLPALGTIIVGAMGQAASPRLARYYVENRRAFVRLTLKLLAAGALLGVVLVALAAAVGRPVLAALFDPEYATHHGAFVWIMAAGGLMYVWSFLEVSVTASRRFRVQVPIYGLAVLSAYVAGWLLIPRFGLHGAAWTMAIASAVGLLGTAAALRRSLSAGAVGLNPVAGGDR